MPKAYRFSVAPMLDYTDRHFRVLMRQVSRHCLLYSEMVVARAVAHQLGEGPSGCDVERQKRLERLMGFDPLEKPLVLQLGGENPGELAVAARLAAAWGYDEVNLNVGCPSSKASQGRFGACLMREPHTVAACVRAMRSASGLPVGIKCRIGLDNDDPETVLPAFLDALVQAAPSDIVIHARKAWLTGLSPADNRRIPPLDYALVRRMRARYAPMPIILNGGLTFDTAHAEAVGTDGVMLGRAVQADPWRLRGVDAQFYDDFSPAIDRRTFHARFAEYLAERMAQGAPFYAVAKHTLNVFRGMPGAAARRRLLSEQGSRPDASVSLFFAAEALLFLVSAVLAARIAAQPSAGFPPTLALSRS